MFLQYSIWLKQTYEILDTHRAVGGSVHGLTEKHSPGKADEHRVVSSGLADLGLNPNDVTD